MSKRSTKWIRLIFSQANVDNWREIFDSIWNKMIDFSKKNWLKLHVLSENWRSKCFHCCDTISLIVSYSTKSILIEYVQSICDYSIHSNEHIPIDFNLHFFPMPSSIDCNGDLWQRERKKTHIQTSKFKLYSAAVNVCLSLVDSYPIHIYT